MHDHTRAFECMRWNDSTFVHGLGSAQTISRAARRPPELESLSITAVLTSLSVDADVPHTVELDACVGEHRDVHLVLEQLAVDVYMSRMDSEPGSASSSWRKHHAAAHRETLG